MKKTVFKGVINGVEFDSVQKYNEEMLKLMADGVSVNAQSQTNTIEEPDLDSDEISEEDLMPFMEGDHGHYLDKLVDGSVEDEDRYNHMCNKLEEARDKLKQHIKGATYDDLLDWKQFYDYAVEIIEQDRDKNNDLLKEIEKKICEVFKNKNVCENASPVIDKMLDFYTKAYELVDDEITARDNMITSTTSNSLEPNEPQTVESQVDNKDSKRACVEKLLKIIFD